jgi:hypothetical protein
LNLLDIYAQNLTLVVDMYYLLIMCTMQ